MESGDFGEDQPGKNQGRKTDERRSRRDYPEGIRVTTAGNWSLNVRRRNERNVSRPYPWISVTYRGGIERFKERNERASLKMFPRWSSTFPTVVLPLKRDPVYLVFYPKGFTPWWACLKHIELPREFLQPPRNPYDVAWFCRIIASQVIEFCSNSFARIIGQCYRETELSGLFFSLRVSFLCLEDWKSGVDLGDEKSMLLFFEGRCYTLKEDIHYTRLMS